MEANSDAESFSALNSRALNYFDAHEGSYVMDEIKIMVEEVSVHSFNISATNFSSYADTKFHLAFNSTSSVFSGNLGATIRDSEGNMLNSIYAEGVGISYLGSDNGEDVPDEITLKGSNYVMEVVETVTKDENGSMNYTYQVNRIAYDSEASYKAKFETDENGEGTNTYYFIMPSISSSSVVDNNSYEISTENQIDNGKFISALFLETEKGYEIFFDESLSAHTQSLQDIFPTFFMSFEVSADNDIYWTNATSETSPLTLVYDTDSMLSDTYDLSKDIFVDETNIYQTVKYFFSSESGDYITGDIPLEYAGSGAYKREALGMTSTDTTEIVLYELNSSFLRAVGGYDGTLYLYFATVRTNADGEIIYVNGKYDIVQFSPARSLVIDATISFGSITPQITIVSASEDDRFLVTGTNGQSNIYLPTELYTNVPEGNADSFTFEISLNSEELISQNQVEDFWTLFNNSTSSDRYLTLEFRTQSGEVWNNITITDVVNDTTDGVVIRGSVDISDGFTDPDGVVLTPWLVYNNGKQVQQKQVDITYNDVKYTTFTVYFQKISKADYAFMEDDEVKDNFISADGEINTVNVKITTQNGVEITWGNTKIEEDGDRTFYDVLSDYLQVHLYDTHGKRIYTNVATYTLQEQINNNYIIINNNRITSFASADNVETSLSAIASGIDGTRLTTKTIPFHIDSEGISGIKKDNTLYANNNPQPTDYVEVDEEEWSKVQVKKYLVIDNQITLSNLIKVYVGEEGGVEEEAVLTFRLNETYIAGLTSEQRNQLFRTKENKPAGNSTNSPMLNLYNNNTLDDDNLLSTLSSDVVALKLAIPFSGDDFSIIFDVKDENGLVNIQLELIILNNLEASPTFDAYEAEYVSPEGYSYLSSYGASEDTIMVFANDARNAIDLDTYLKLNYIDQGNETKEVGWDGNLIIYANRSSNPVGTAGQTDPITVDGSVITFNDVTAATIVSLKIYFKAVNSYTYSINLNFIVNPNYAFVRNGEYINIQEVDQNPIDLLDRYELYRATEIIAYINNYMVWADVIKFQQLPEGITLTYDDTDNSNQIICINGNQITRRQRATLNISLGGAERVSIGFTFTDNDNNFTILMFDFENQEMTSFERTKAFTFDVGYGENNDVNRVIETLLPKENQEADYELRQTEEGYLLVLLENKTYIVGDGWSVDSGNVVQPNPNRNGFVVGTLSNFNVEDTISFTKNGDKIRVNTLLTKIGLEYVKYSTEYEFDIITTTNPNDLVENNIYQEFTAGKEDHQIVYVENEAYVDEEDDDYGFHYIDSGTPMTATLSVYSSTVSGLVSTSGNTITINSLVESEQEVFVILELNLRANVNAGFIDHNIYYRIKVLPNYTLSEVSYPYSDNAEYLREKDFTLNENEELVHTINFNDEFTSCNAQTSVIGEKRFADLYNMDGEVVENDATYSISVSVNYGEPLTDYSQYLRLNCQNGSLEITLLDTSARIEITVVKSFKDVYNSSREYHIIINGSPKYEVYVDNILNNLEHDITVGEAYLYNVSVMEKQDNNTETPITNLKGHITSSNEDLLVPFIIGVIDGETAEGATPVYTYSAGIIGSTPQFLSITGGDSKYIDVTILASFEDNDEEYYSITANGGQYAVLANDLQFFDLSLNEDNATYTLYFKTVSSISSDDVLTIGLYNDYENITDLVFNMDGGYNITYAEEMSGSYASGTSYTIRNFITSIFAHTDEEQTNDLTESFTYSLVDENEQRVILDDERNVTVAYSNEPFSVQFSATYSGYTFIFTVNFLASFNPNNVSTTVVDSSIHNSQDTISLSTVEDGLIKTKIAELFASSRDTIDTFTFASNNTDSFTISTVNVSENNTSYRQTITINYKFNENVIFSFDLIYSYTVSPNVYMVMNYPNPENLAETDFTSEYITNDAEGTNVINNFFNTSTDFIAKVGDNKPARVQATSVGRETNTYNYSITISISAINNVTISTGDGTFSSVGDVLGSSSSTASGRDSLTLPELNLKFTLNGSGASGRVTFAININGVIRYYSVTVTTTSPVTVETNAVNRENSSENLFAEDLTNQNLNIFTKDRLLRYEFLSGASGTYVAKFVHEDGSTLYKTLDVDTSGEVLIDLGKSYEGYQYAGTFKSEVDAKNNTNAYNDGEVFVTAPSLTSRIILRYAGRVVSKDVASIYLDGSKMENVPVTKDFYNKTTTYPIGYSFDNGININSTKNQYSVYLSLKFKVNSDATSHYEELIAGNEYSLLEDFSASFGIMNPELNTYYTPAMFENSGSLELRIYGFSDMPINTGNTYSSEALTVHTALTNGTSSLAPGEVFETGLIPRYDMTLNADKPETNIQSNYATIEEIPVGGTSDRTQDYEIYASGAGNNGNFIMMRLTYVVEFGNQKVEESANLTFKIMPNLTVTFLSDNNTTNAQPGSTEEIDGETYLTNSARPYTISLSSSQDQYLYTNSAGEKSILTVNLAGNSTNLAGTFDYTFPYRSSGFVGGYNRYDNSTPKPDKQGLRITNYTTETDADNKWISSTGKFTFDGTAKTSQIPFTANIISLGDRDYYFDAVDNHGFNIRIYIRISASLSPQIYDVTSSAREGDPIQIGVRHTEVKSSPITLTSTISADESDLPLEKQDEKRYNGKQYNYSYNLGRDESTAPRFLVNGTDYDDFNNATTETDTGTDKDDDGIIGNKNVVYVYTRQEDGEGQLFATQNFKLARREAGAQEITMYVNTTEAKGIEADTLLRVYYTRGDDITGKYNEYLIPTQTTSSARPEFTSADGLQVILDGFNVYTYDNSDGLLAGIPYNPEFASNFLDVEIFRISLEYNGETIVSSISGANSSTVNDSNRRLVVGKDKYIYSSSGVSETPASITSGNYRIPTLPAHLYGASNVVEDVVLVITLTDDEDNSCEIRTTVDIERERTGEFNYDSVLDTTVINSTGMFGTADGIYNDTLEITLQSGATLEYAITTSNKTPADSAYTQLPVNNNDYAVTYYARISEEFENLSSTISSRRYVHIRSTQGDYTIKYGGGVITPGESFNIGTIGSKNLTLRINDIGELNNAGYVTRQFYTIVSSGGKLYQQDNETNVYPIYTSVAGADPTTARYTVSNYYTVSNGTDTYYVIAPEQWADSSSDTPLDTPLITLSSHANVVSSFGANDQYRTIRNNATISGTPYNSGTPYKFTYEIDGATIDSMGTITTSTSFGLNSNTITVKVYMKVSGEDGNFNSDRGKLIGTLAFTLGSSTLTGGSVSRPGIYRIGNSVVPIDDDYTLTGGSGRTIYFDPDVNSYTVQVGEEFVFSEKFGTESGHYNSHYTIVQENSKSNYLFRGNENSYTYSSTGKYTSTFVESYVSGGIQYQAFKATVVVYDENITTEISASAQMSTGKYSVLELFDQAGIVGVSEVYDCETGEKVSDTGTGTTGIDVSSAGIKTLSLAVVNGTSVSHYTVNLLVYESEENKDVAWILNSRYDLSNIFGNNTVYKIENNALKEVSGEYLSTTPASPISYYVEEGGTLNRYNITYHIHSSTQTDTSVIWFENAETTISDASLLNALGFAGTCTIYSVDSTTREIEKIEGAYNLDDAENVFTREFLVNDGTSNYLRKVAFYRYTDKTADAIDVATVYDNNFIMANLNSIVRERITGGTISYFTYNKEAGALNQANNFNLLAQTAVDDVVTQDFYVLVNNEYYKFTVNFYCTRSRVSTNIVVKDSTDLTYLISDGVKGSLGIPTGDTQYYEITNSYLKSSTTVTDVSMPAGDYSAKYVTYLCIVTTADAEGVETKTNYILDIMFLYNNGGEIDTSKLFTSSISTTTVEGIVFNLNNVANTVANKLFGTTMANISFYESSDGEAPPITSITLTESDEQYYLVTCFVKENTATEGRTQIFLLIENNISGGVA